jgi:adenine-specific DNA-methyltransferase
MGRRWVTAEILTETVEKFTRARLEKVVAGEDAGGITKAVGWAGGGGFRSVTVAPSMYEVTPLGLMLSEQANDGDFAEAMAGQLGFDWLPVADSMLCGTRGRMRLAVLDNSVGVEEARQILAELTENQRVTIVAKVVLPGVEELIAQESKGSRVLKAPRDVLVTRGRSRRQQREASTPAETVK